MIYLTSFTLSDHKNSCPNIYPYNVFRGREGKTFFFGGITVLYGDNGSGKSTILNLISNKLGIKGSEYATPNTYGNVDYMGRFIGECSFGMGEDEFGRTLRRIPDVSRYIKSEDILYEIKKIWQKGVLGDGMLYDLVADGMDRKKAEGLVGSTDGWKLLEDKAFRQEKYSNGETSVQYFDEMLKPGGLYLLDEPEVSLSPSNQVYLSKKINEMVRFFDCQFIIATHSPFMLGELDSKIYDLDSRGYSEARWTDLENVRYFFRFFDKHKDEFEGLC
ncbi:Predicted ATPase [Oscillospiraceae bacterium]|nr:Predicted ATPase [Oscillospiraceae bacterium]